MSKPRKQTEEAKSERTDPITEETEAVESAEREAIEAGEEADFDASEPDSEDPLEILRRERDAFEEKWLRAVAEMENVRRRARRDVQEGRRFAQADLLRPLLDVYDNFERALQAFPADADDENDTGIRQGVDLIFQKFRSVLKERGVEEISALDTEFDPRIHEAVGQLAREGVEAGVVIEVVQPGFQLGPDFVLRPARVIVAG